MEKVRLTEPNGTETRISRCTDQQVLPVGISTNKDFISFSDRANRAKSMKLKKVYKDTNNLIVTRGFSVLLGFISDIIAINRRHLKELLYRVKNGGLGDNDEKETFSLRLNIS